MAYITEAELKQYIPNAPTNEETPVILEIASIIIDAMTGGKIGSSLDHLPGPIQEKVKHATAEQCRTIVLSGGIDGISGAQPASVSLGRFSYSSGSKSSSKDEAGPSLPRSDIAYLILSTTGLLYAGMEIRP